MGGLDEEGMGSPLLIVVFVNYFGGDVYENRYFHRYLFPGYQRGGTNT
jgi:hypothetical protein